MCYFLRYPSEPLAATGDRCAWFRVYTSTANTSQLSHPTRVRGLISNYLGMTATLAGNRTPDTVGGTCVKGWYDLQQSQAVINISPTSTGVWQPIYALNL